MKKASALLVTVFFLILAWPVEAQTLPAGYFKHGDFFCNSNTDFEKPDSAGVWPVIIKFCQPQEIGCRAAGGKFCTAGTGNYCCPTSNTCGKGTTRGFEVAVCVPPVPAGAACAATSPGYAGRTKEGKNICCRADQEPGPAGGKSAPYCQPRSRSVCAPGERFVQGAGAYQGEKRCCPNNTAPSHHPNGLPFCARLPQDTAPPTIVLTVPDKYLKIENKHLWLADPRVSLYAYDSSGLASASIGVLAPGLTGPLVKNCVANQTSTFCTLIVPKNKWVIGTMIFITAKDQSSNGNVSFEGYKLISSGQLQKQDTSGSKIIIPPAPTVACHTFNINLSIGMSGSEVTALQKVLTRAGFPVSETGSFDESTASAVSSFQLQYRNELLTARGLNYPTGYFGPTTRQKMNQLYGC